MTAIPKHVPLPEVWKQLEGDAASKQQALARVVAERVREANLSGGAVAEVKQLLDAGDLDALQRLLDSGAVESAAAPYDVARFGMRGGGFSSLFASAETEKTPHELTRAEALLGQGNVEEALLEVAFNPSGRVELCIGTVLRSLEAGQLRAAHRALEELNRPKDPAVAELLRAFEPAGWFARLRDTFKEPNPDAITFSAQSIAALGGRFATLRAGLARLAGPDGSLAVSKHEPAGDFRVLIERGAELVPREMVELAEKIRNYESDTESGGLDMKLANMYRRGASGMSEIRNQLLASSPLRPQMAQRLARTAQPSDPDNRMVHEDQVFTDIAEALMLTGPSAMQTIRWISNHGTRANATPGFRDLNVGQHGGGNKATLYHELGHHYEFNNPEILAACRAWLDARVTGDAQPLNDLIEKGHYGPEEKARPDHFVSPYVGKVYPELTEVVSMGLEHLHADHTTMKLLVEDPEHLFLTLGIILATRP